MQTLLLLHHQSLNEREDEMQIEIESERRRENCRGFLTHASWAINLVFRSARFSQEKKQSARSKCGNLNCVSHKLKARLS